MKVTLPRANHFLLFGILLVVILIYAKSILVPITLAALLAMLMAPLCRWLDGKGWPRALSSLVCVLILLVFIAGVLSIVTVQIINFSKDIPQMEKKANMILSNIQEFVQDRFKVEPEEQVAFAKKQITNLGKSLGSRIGGIVSGVTTTIATVILMLVFTFLMLFSKERFENFFIQLYKEEDTAKTKKVLAQITNVSQDYLTGRAISMCIQAVAFSVGLSIIGIKNGVLLGCLAALLTILPYVGPVTGGLFPILTSIVTEDSMQTTFWVIGLLVFIQICDNYFIEPNVVGGKVHLNALITIIIIIVGGTLWGVPGMIIFTPLLGIVKIICDHVEELKPYSYLIGDDEKDSTTRFSEWWKKALRLAGKK